ncbi:hypothetical protein KDA23_01715 [Candidatus Saccharibacteria bacterium]|nr:hypothetical protein [Candidatus Saccharibacteria bacterium]
MFRKPILIVAVFTLLVVSVLVAPLQQANAATKSPCEKYFTNQGKPWLAKRCRTTSVVSHRAKYTSSSTTNENTMKALKFDGKIGVGCETDTWRLASDDGAEAQGRSVIFHDTTIGRVVTDESIAAARDATGASEADLNPQTKMSMVTYAQFTYFRTTGGEPLPTLKQWVNYAANNKIPCNIEIKWKPSDAELIATVTKLRATKMLKKITFWNAPTTNHACSTANMEEIIDNPDLLGIVVGFKQTSECPLSPQDIHDKGYGYTTLPGGLTLSERKNFVKQVHDLGMTAGSPVSLDKIAGWKQNITAKVDYIMTNKPKALRDWLRG